MSVSLENTRLLQNNLAIARNYNIVSWYLTQFAEIEKAQHLPRTNAQCLNLICKQARRRLLIKIGGIK
tara:strand:- start:1025 stop:1228 length:204 start_codon:yes stop_codon:yes gene_type:complete